MALLTNIFHKISFFGTALLLQKKNEMRMEITSSFKEK